MTQVPINSCWRAITWFRDAYIDFDEPEFKEKFEELFKCKIIWSEVSDSISRQSSSVPEYLEFESEKEATLFLLKWT